MNRSWAKYAICRVITAAGVAFRWGSTVERLLLQPGSDGARARVAGLQLADGSTLPASHVVLAPGHSARALYRSLHADGVALSAQGTSVGFRIEHLQATIDELQLGGATAAGVERGRGQSAGG